MAIPTQFSVTSTRSSSIANPLLPQDAPQVIDAENVSIVDGANVLVSLASGAIDAPIEATAQPVTDIDNAVTIPAESAETVGAPTAASAQAAAAIDNASALPAESAAAVDTPAAATSESASAIATPAALTAKPGTATTPPFALNHARILWDNLLTNYVSVAKDSGQTPANALTPNTWQRWTFGAGGSVTITLPTNVDIDTVCIGAHNLSGSDYTVGATYDTTTSGSFVAFATGKTPTTNSAIMFHRATSVSVRRLRITCSGTGVGRFIGYISAGIALQMQRPFFNGHTPITDGDATQYYSNRTESGEIIGQQIRRQGFETSAEWQNLDDTWYRTYFAPFKQAAKLRPFFFAWNLLEYPDDVGFCRISQDISAPMQNGVGTKRSVSMKLLGAG